MRILFTLLCALMAIPASAQLNRSFVATTGSDLNPCTPAAPCRSFVVAIAQTNPGGEVVALDSGGYGPFTVDRAVTIAASPGVHAAVTATSGVAATIAAAATDTVALRGIRFSGLGAAAGVYSLTAESLLLDNVSVKGFPQGVSVQHEGSALITGSLVHDNTTVGIEFLPSVGLLEASVVDTKVYNSNTGIAVGVRATVAMRNIVSSGNRENQGVLVYANDLTGPSRAMIADSLISGNRIGIEVVHNVDDIFSSTATISNVTVSGNQIGLDSSGTAGFIVTFGNNQVTDNDINGAPDFAIPRV